MGTYFLSIVFILFVISLAYGNALAYSCTFIFVSVVMTSATHTHFNLKNIRVLSFSNPRVASESDQYKLELILVHDNRSKKFDITALSENAEIKGIDKISNNERKLIYICLNNLKRGSYFFNRVTLTTKFPFGLFYSWTYANVESQFYISPSFTGKLKLPMKSFEDDRAGISKSIGLEEFSEHQKHVKGMPYNHIDWKLYAKDKGFYVKTFERDSSSYYYFSIKNLSELDEELALNQLASWIKVANKNKEYWVLDLGNVVTKPDTGDSFFNECLISLAKYNKEEVEIAL